MDRAVVLTPDRLVLGGGVNDHRLDGDSHLDGDVVASGFRGDVVAGHVLCRRRDDTPRHERRVGRRFTLGTLPPQRGHTSLLVIMV